MYVMHAVSILQITGRYVIVPSIDSSTELRLFDIMCVLPKVRNSGNSFSPDNAFVKISAILAWVYESFWNQYAGI